MTLTRSQLQLLRELIQRQEGYVAWQAVEHGQQELAPFVSPPIGRQQRTIQALVNSGHIQPSPSSLGYPRRYRPTQKGRAVA